MESKRDYNYFFRVCVLGDSPVGKTQLRMRFSEDTFSEAFFPTIGVEMGSNTLKVNNETVKIQIWDHGCQENFRLITSMCYRDMHGMMLVYDITNEKSFLSIDEWIQKLDMYTHHKNVCKVLVGNKCDLDSERQVTYEEGEKRAKQYGMKFVEASAKRSTNVDTIFKEIASLMLLEFGDQRERKHSDKATKLSLSEENKRSTCF